MTIVEPNYRVWQQDRLTVGNRTYVVATKPGVTAHGRDDTGTHMLAEAVAQAVAEAAGQIVISMPCGNGAVGAVAAGSGAGRVYMLDRNVVAVLAANETLAANDMKGVVARVGQGAAKFPAGVQADVVAIRVVPDALTMKQLIYDAGTLLRPGGRCLLAGANDEGAKTAARLLERYFGQVKTLAQRRGHRMVSAIRPERLAPPTADWHSPFFDPDHFHIVTATVRGRAIPLHTRPGVFSWQHVDEASALLVDHLTVHSGERVLDLGCGAGLLGIVAAFLSETGTVHMVDADSEAVRCTNATIAALGMANARAMVSDIAEAVRGEQYDVVVTNPPFHIGKHTDLAVPRQFIRDAFHVLRPGGRLVLVANRTLPYERVIADQFGAVTIGVDGRRFKVLEATK